MCAASDERIGNSDGQVLLGFVPVDQWREVYIARCGDSHHHLDFLRGHRFKPVLPPDRRSGVATLLVGDTLVQIHLKPSFRIMTQRMENLPEMFMDTKGNHPVCHLFLRRVGRVFRTMVMREYEPAEASLLFREIDETTFTKQWMDGYYPY